MPPRKNLNTVNGFTLAELLISLAILGVIATFTIPKILVSQQNQKYNAIAKEAIATVSDAYQQYKTNNTVTSSFTMNNLTPYINYVSVDSSSPIDDINGYGTFTCSNCLRLHNGGVLYYFPWDVMGGTGPLNATAFYVDPDGVVTDSTTNGPGKSIRFFLYVNGRIVDNAENPPGTSVNGFIFNPVASTRPSWFSWN